MVVEKLLKSIKYSTHFPTDIRRAKGKLLFFFCEQEKLCAEQ